MKKILSFIILVVIMIAVTACKDEPTNDKTYTLSLFSYMDTFVSVSFVVADDEEANRIKADIETIFMTYHELSTHYEPLAEESGFKTNIFEINSRPNEVIEIDPELYDLLFEAEVIREATDGYFNVAVGKIVDTWKSNILSEDGYLFAEIPEDVFANTIEQANSYPVPEIPFELFEANGTHTIRLLYDNVKIDLGAIAKGYATELAKDYMIGLGITYFSISAGSSSIALGQNIKRIDDGGLFHVSLANPVRTGSDDGTYGMTKVKDTAVTTSGNYEQYATYQGARYHHIVSPLTKKPEQYYHTVTLIGEDAGLLDALSTALFSMDPATFEAWFQTHGEDYGIEVIRFNTDGTISTFLDHSVFEDTR